jgi:hypothetical protein
LQEACFHAGFPLDLEKRRAEVLAEISSLGDFRPGSISTTRGRCGTNPAAQRKAERELEGARHLA